MVQLSTNQKWIIGALAMFSLAYVNDGHDAMLVGGRTATGNPYGGPYTMAVDSNGNVNVTPTNHSSDFQFFNAKTSTGASAALQEPLTTTVNGATGSQVQAVSLHFSALYIQTGTCTTVSISIQASPDNSHWINVSTAGTSTTSGQLTATGPFEYWRLNIATLTGASCSISAWGAETAF